MQPYRIFALLLSLLFVPAPVPAAAPDPDSQSASHHVKTLVLV